MPILFYSEGPSVMGDDAICTGGPRKSKSISLEDLKKLTREFFVRTQQPDIPVELREKILAGGRFPLKEVQMLISQNPDAEFLQVNYGIDASGKHFHYMFPAKETIAANGVVDNTLIIEDCCRIPPNSTKIDLIF